MQDASLISLERMATAVEKVHQRLIKACALLEKAGLGYAVAGGNAVAAWVSTVDEAAVRNSRGVDILIRREDFEKVKSVLESGGFYYRHGAGRDIFLESATGSVRDSVHLIFAGEFVKPGEPFPNPSITSSERNGTFTILSLEALVTIKLTAHRDFDRTHLRDLIETGLLDWTWLSRWHPVLAQRLAAILDDPLG